MLVGAALALLLHASPARAWSSLGHRVVARIAEDRLSPEAKRELQRLFGEPHALETVAACPDLMLASTAAVRCGAAWTLAPDAEHKTAPWHFINIPIGDAPGPRALEPYCAGGCVVEAVRAQRAALRRPGATDEDKRFAIMYLVHLIGDLHQPLHCANDNDRGGNDKWVLHEGERYKLHELWDGMLRPMPKTGRRRSRSPGPIVRRVQKLLLRADTAAWTRGDSIADAALESHDIARRSIYPGYRVDLPVGEDYRRRFEPVVDDRLARAGVRLAALLEEALAP